MTVHNARQTDRQFYLTSEKIRYQGEENDRKVFESSSPKRLMFADNTFR